MTRKQTIRRLPTPRPPAPLFNSNSGHFEFTREAANNHLVEAITAEIHRLARASGLSPFIILKDFIKMMEPSLACRAENMRSIATTGQIITDPPEIAAIFRAARERYRAATERNNPSVYRMMQESFVQMYAWLIDLPKTPGNPDIVGQVFLHCLDYPRKWHPFFPSWASCQQLAAQLIPDPKEAIYEVITQAALEAAEPNRPYPELQPGANWEEFYLAIAPHITPALVGPELISSSPTMLLALVDRFSEWAVAHHLIHFDWQTAKQEPLISTMCHLNVLIYGLNGEVLKQAETLMEIIQHREQEQSTNTIPPTQPPYLEPLEHKDRLPPQPDIPTFADMFNQGGKKP